MGGVTGEEGVRTHFIREEVLFKSMYKIEVKQ